jgi:hypothetical protein
VSVPDESRRPLASSALPLIPGGRGTRNAAAIDALDAALTGAALLGLELDSRFRVLAATLELTTDHFPWANDAVTGDDDRRVQLLCSPVSTILGSLVDVAEGRTSILTFTADHLVDVVASLDGPCISSPVFGRPEPRPGLWAPRFSLEGRSSASDGRSTTITLETATDTLRFALFARFDVVEIRNAAGDVLNLP